MKTAVILEVQQNVKCKWMSIFSICTKSAYRMYSNSTKSERSENENRNL